MVNWCCAFPTHIPLQLMPEMNSVWDSAAGESKISPTVDISVAVATPNGLITPIVSNADQRTIPEIAAVFKVSAEQSNVWKDELQFRETLKYRT